MRRHKNQIAYPQKKIIAVLRTLNEFVVSLDQISSASYDVTKEEHGVLLADFIQRHKIFQKMAQARKILSAHFSTKLGADEMDELEREMEGVLYWNDRRKAMSLKKGKR
jgi:hypothetical protein